MNATPMTIDRRALLKLAATLPAVAALPLLSACSRDAALPDGAPFSLWQRVRDALRTSPDLLAARAQDVTAGGDLQAIFAFVRDEIALRPWATPQHYLRVQSAGYAGVRGVLRSGLATVREKAELLQSLLAEAGFAAEIVDGDIDFEALGGAARFTRSLAPRFAPDPDTAPLDDWLQVLGITPVPGLRTAALDQATLDETAAQLLAAIPAEARKAPEDWTKLNNWVSLVRVTRDGETVYANPSVPDAVLGEHYCKREPRPSPVQGEVPTPTLKLSLAMTRRSAPGKPETVLEGEWPVGDLVGRRLQLRFMPTLPADMMLSMSFAQLRTFQPAFVVAGSDMADKDAARLGVSGDVITLEGERLSQDGNDILVDGRKLALGNADPALAASVDSIDLTVNASEYPRLRIEAGLRDSSNAPVNGLPLSVLGLQHGGQPAAARLLRNLPEGPRVAFALDFSTSLDEAYRGVKLAPVVERMCRAVTEQVPGAQFRVGAFKGGAAGTAVQWYGGWSESVTAAAETIRREGPTAPQSSSYFTALADATNSDANLVVLITDADGAGSERPDTAALISQGCPAVVVGVPGPLTRDEHFERLAQLSGGHLFMVAELDAAVDAIADLADSGMTRPYVFEIVADAAADADAHVRLSVPASGAMAETAYERPAEFVSPPRALCGLFLTVELGKRRVTRRLAGFPLVSPALKELGDADINATRLALFGRYDLSVEGAAPTAAAALDDILASYLSCENLVAAATSRDEETILAATQAGFDVLPRGWLNLNTPLPGARSAGHLSFQAGYRLILFSEAPDISGHYRHKVDILPFADWRTVGPADAFATNLKHTLQLSMLEAENYADSTLARVGETSYVHVASHMLNNWATSLDDEESSRQWRIAAADRGQPRLPLELLMPADASQFGFWEIDTATGSVLGMLPDASGGATAEDTERTFELLVQVIDAYTQIMQALIATPPAFKVWVELEKAKLEHLKRATIALILMDGTYTSGYGDLLADQVEGWITDQAQGAIDDAIGDVLGGYSEAQEVIGWHDRAQQMWNAANNGTFEG